MEPLKPPVETRGFKRKVVVSLYPEDPPWSELWEKFKEICRREGETVTEKLVEFISKYVEEKQRKYNPQTAITKFVEAPVMEAPRVTASREEFWRWVRTLPEAYLYRLEYTLDDFRFLTLEALERARRAVR